MSALDAYVLPGRLLVRLLEDATGSITIRPVSDRWARRVGESNAYNGSCEVFAQEAHWRDWCHTLPRSAFYGRGKSRGFNSGARFYLDSWTFRHLVGGQSD